MTAYTKKFSIVFILLSLVAGLVNGQANVTAPTNPPGMSSNGSNAGSGGTSVVTSDSNSASSPTDFPPCNVCGEGNVIGNLDALPIDNEESDVETCAELQELADSGAIHPDLCEQIPDMVEIACGCRAEGDPSSATTTSTMTGMAALLVLFGSLAAN